MLAKIKKARQLPKNTAEYRKACFDFTDSMTDIPKPTKESNELWEIYRHNDLYKNNIRNRQAPTNFFQNEVLNNVDIKPIIKKLQAQNIKFYAIYGKQDGR